MSQVILDGFHQTLSLFILLLRHLSLARLYSRHLA